MRTTWSTTCAGRRSPGIARSSTCWQLTPRSPLISTAPRSNDCATPRTTWDRRARWWIECWQRARSGAKLRNRTAHPAERSPAMDVTLLRTLGRNWWLVLLRGIVSIAFGVLAWAWPGATLVTLTLFWGAYALVDGVS